MSNDSSKEPFKNHKRRSRRRGDCKIVDHGPWTVQKQKKGGCWSPLQSPLLSWCSMSDYWWEHQDFSLFILFFIWCLMGGTVMQWLAVWVVGSFPTRDLSVRSLRALPVHVWVLSDFLPQSKNVTGDSKLPECGISVIENGWIIPLTVVWSANRYVGKLLLGIAGSIKPCW